MGAERVGLRETVMTMSRLDRTVNKKMDRKTMKSIFCKCGFYVSPRRTNAVTLWGGLRTALQQGTASWGLTYLQRNKKSYSLITKDLCSDFYNKIVQSL